MAPGNLDSWLLVSDALEGMHFLRAGYLSHLPSGASQGSHSACYQDGNWRVGSGPGNRGVRNWDGQQLIKNQGQVFIGPGKDWGLPG